MRQNGLYLLISLPHALQFLRRGLSIFKPFQFFYLYQLLFTWKTEVITGTNGTKNLIRIIHYSVQGLSPKTAVPILTMLEPSSMATLYELVIPIERNFILTFGKVMSLILSNIIFVLLKYGLTFSGLPKRGPIVIKPSIRKCSNWDRFITNFFIYPSKGSCSSGAYTSFRVFTAYVDFYENRHYLLFYLYYSFVNSLCLFQRIDSLYNIEDS